MKEFNVNILSLLILMSLLSHSYCFLGIPDFLEFGSCAQVHHMTNFDPLKYQNTWFDIERVPNEYQKAEYCITENFSWSGTSMSVAMVGISEDGVRVSSLAELSPEGLFEGEEKEEMISLVVNSTGVPAAPYKVLWTDYSCISCVYSCLEFVAFRAEFFWILSRSPNPPQKYINKCLSVFNSNNINIKKLKPVVQGANCEYQRSSEDLSNRKQGFGIRDDKLLISSNFQKICPKKPEDEVKQVMIKSEAVLLPVNSGSGINISSLFLAFAVTHLITRWSSAKDCH